MKVHCLLAMLISAVANRKAAMADNEMLRGVTRREQECLICQILPLQAELENGDEVDFECRTEVDGDEYPDMPYQINLPDEFVANHRTELESGDAFVCIHGGQAVRNATGDDVIVFPTDGAVQLMEGVEHEAVEGHPAIGFGNRTVLVVRVSGPIDSEIPHVSSERLAGAIFGIGNESFQNPMSTQYRRCSFNALNFIPASGFPEIVDGVIDIQLNSSLRAKQATTVHQDASKEVRKLLGVNSLADTFDHVMYCLAGGTLFGSGNNRKDSWLAFALAYALGTRTENYSVYNSKSASCDKLSILMHEIGHNLGFQHSGDAGNSDYGDTSGTMGYSDGAIDGPKSCFNANKNWLLGWYSDKRHEVPKDARWNGRLVPFVEYELADTSRNEFILVRVDDKFVQFNRAKSFNAGTREDADEVVIVQGDALRNVNSMKLASLSASQIFRHDGVTFEVCAINTGYPDYAELAVYPVGTLSTCPTIPTPRPTPSPTPDFTRSPTAFPTASMLPTETVVTNDNCATAEFLSELGEYIGTTNGATPDQDEAEKCLGRSPGVWYRLRGTGEEMTVSTCHEATTFDTVLSLFVGDCGSLSCAAMNDDLSGCLSKSGITWNSEEGVEYKLLVYGFSNQAGPFGLVFGDPVTPSPTVQPPSLAPSISYSPSQSAAPTTSDYFDLAIASDCSVLNPCGLCRGECDRDSQCAPGLRCYDREGLENISGCTGRGRIARDYCYRDPSLEEAEPSRDPELEIVGQCTAASPCGLCQGDCDSDDECEVGLICKQRGSFEQVPGCSGLGRGGLDYCYPQELEVAEPLFRVTQQFERASSCTIDSPCGECQGDCNRDSDCGDGLRCFQRSGDEPVPGCRGASVRAVDYCFKDPSFKIPPPSNDPELTYVGDCSRPGVSCGLCEGDCYEEDDCEEGLSCFHRGGFEPIPGCSGLGRIGFDYCYLPIEQPEETGRPSDYPSSSPSGYPSSSVSPSGGPTVNPSSSPTGNPTDSVSPSANPTENPTGTPSDSVSPTGMPSDNPSGSPSDSAAPTSQPTGSPTGYPSGSPTRKPSDSASPSISPTGKPTGKPSDSVRPTGSPSATPSGNPSDSHSPTGQPSGSPTVHPTGGPTGVPSGSPTDSPSPSINPTGKPTGKPSDSVTPSATPSGNPSDSDSPTGQPSGSPTGVPSGSPTDSPSPSRSPKPSDTPSLGYAIFR